MSDTQLARLEDLYEQLEGRLAVAEGPPALAEAVQFRSNRARPVHRWFHFKEGFAADIFAATGVDTSALMDDSALFVDPFCGCGTTLVAGDLQQMWRARRVGIEVNPFLAFVAQTKANWRRFDANRLRCCLEQVLREPLSEDLDSSIWPHLSTFHNVEMFTKERASALVDAARRVRAVTEPERALLLLGLAAAAERSGLYRKDGRALRILRNPGELEERHRHSVASTLRRVWTGYAQDLDELREDRERKVGDCLVVRADGRALPLCAENGEATLMLYSPPYLNHIDYTEVYKVELWLLGFVEQQTEMLALRKQTLRSHGSIGVEETDPDLGDVATCALDVAGSIVRSTGKQWHRRFPALLRAYVTDLRRSLQEQYAALCPGARAICVVSNSAHGSGAERVPIAADLLIATAAQCEGFEVERLLIARRLRRRDHLNRFLRESVIVLRRPA